MKRIHGLSAVLGMVFTLGLVGACNAWENNHLPSTASSSSGMGVIFGGDRASSGRSQDSPYSGTSNSSKYGTPYASAGGEVAATGDYATIRFSSLPREAQDVIWKIKARSTFPFPQDGQVFSNREGILPERTRGYYHEYTVLTPGVNHRGARRVVAGSGTTGDVATAGEYYYTDDHYSTFSRVTK